eukprot:TRINITY_DN9677_c0_g1_i2.p1 TRINITY_DN9677_c0_g1~~TRINITY_DN9677_c0_g1_i2.p1  ORF type:complete len:303 (+),score=51.40 TRINITY_DN9677_c0_g1_i2:43-951(+)
MYHGDRIPGFPAHPHRGFETLTLIVEGHVDHADSMGGCGRYGNGDMQWLTAGSGVVHGELFPLLNADGPNLMESFQIWLNLPAKSKMVDPHFDMHWNENIPRITSPDQKSTVKLWAGELAGVQAGASPPHSWAADPDNELVVCVIHLHPGGTFTVPAARHGAAINRSFYFFEGSNLTLTHPASAVSSSHRFHEHVMIHTNGELEVELKNESQTEGEEGSEGKDSLTRVLMLQGRPIAERVVQHGPFVMNSQQEIQQAFMDYQRTRFGGWPWDEEAFVFPRDKGRFSKRGPNAPEEYPPSRST